MILTFLIKKGTEAIFYFLERFSPRLAGRLGVGLFLRPMRTKLRASEEKLADLARSEIVVTDGNHLHVRHWGRGPKILLAHGWSSQGLSFAFMIEHLTSLGYSVIVPDFPAHGSSPGKSSNAFEFGNTVATLLVKYKEIYALVGHSIGGLACIMGAIEAGDNLKKLVTINTPVHFDHVLDHFIDVLNGGIKMRQHMERIIFARFKRGKSDFSAVELIEEIPQAIDLLVVQDDSDPEVSISAAEDLASKGRGTLHITVGLGHNRSIRDVKNVERIVEFLESV